MIQKLLPQKNLFIKRGDHKQEIIPDFLKRSCRSHEVKLKLSKEEKIDLQKKAYSYGLKISQYIRMVSINAKVIVY